MAEDPTEEDFEKMMENEIKAELEGGLNPMDTGKF